MTNGASHVPTVIIFLHAMLSGVLRRVAAKLSTAAVTGSACTAAFCKGSYVVTSPAWSTQIRGFASTTSPQGLAVGGRYLLAAFGAAAAGIWASEDVYTHLYLVPKRLFLDVFTAAAIVVDYKLSLKPGLEGEERAKVLAECHQRGADRLLQLCFKNGGIYTKLGQHVGQLDHLLPEEYVVTMRNNLLNRCPVTPYEDVRRIIAQDLGLPPEVLFRSFNPNPIASASLAQVHVAESHDGRKLAVKVQHPGLRESSTADIATIEALVKAVRTIFPEFDYQWLVDEVKTNLPCELDFKCEAGNAERCRANLEGPRSKLAGRVHIPWIDHKLTSHRVLCMEYIAAGAPITDSAGLQRMGIDRAALSRLIAETFNQMIFVHGDVHADPHAANLLVRRQDGRMQLVLLDHGLYRRISDEFRYQYAALWRALIFADIKGIQRSSEAMGAGDMVPLFAGMLTQRPWDEIVGASTPDLDRLQVSTDRESRKMLQGYAAQYSREISTLLLRIPHELLLLLKTNDCLRSVDNILGQPVNNFVITARESSRALAEQQVALQSKQSRAAQAMGHVLLTLEMVRVELRMLLFAVAVRLEQVTRALRLKRPPKVDPEVVLGPQSVAGLQQAAAAS